MSASMEARLAEHVAAPIPPTKPSYDQAPLGHRAAMICMRDDIPEEDMPPRRIFVLTAPPPRCDVVESCAAVARAPRVADIAEQESKIFYTQLHDARTDRRDIRLEIDVVRGQRTAYETKLHESQRAEDDAIRQIMCTQVLEARARINTVEDAGGGIRRPIQNARVCSYPEFMKCQPLNFKGTEGVVSLSHWLEKIESVFHISGCAIENQVNFATCTLLGAALTWWNGHVRGNDVAAYTQRFQELALMCTKFLADKTAKIEKYIGGLPNNIHGNVMSARPKTLDFAIELANDLMDQKLRTYAERQNENKRKADDSSRIKSPTTTPEAQYSC
ncbi:hypothetical protein Tco_0199102 [Tanacetum coccineum]